MDLLSGAFVADSKPVQTPINTYMVSYFNHGWSAFSNTHSTGHCLCCDLRLPIHA
jgi:hypothetical protein